VRSLVPAFMKPGGPILNQPVVLLVEDEPLVRATQVDILREAGFWLLEAQDADEAFDHLGLRQSDFRCFAFNSECEAHVGRRLSQKKRPKHQMFSNYMLNAKCLKTRKTTSHTKISADPWRMTTR
jgi:hypothetical protein